MWDLVLLKFCQSFCKVTLLVSGLRFFLNNQRFTYIQLHKQNLLICFISLVNQQKYLIVETHSEHLITRLQRRIAEGGISPDDVAIYYCFPSETGTEVKRIWLNQFGQFQDEGLPPGFLMLGMKRARPCLKLYINEFNRGC